MGNVYSAEAEKTECSRDAMNAVQRAVKRLLDFVFALIGLVLLSPVFLIIYIMLKRQKNGPAIFSQERIGYGGRPFTIYKFRTMSGEEDAPRLVAKCDETNSTKTERFLREHPGQRHRTSGLCGNRRRAVLLRVVQHRGQLGPVRLHGQYGENVETSAHGHTLS